jgi:group I intron endonuclease
LIKDFFSTLYLCPAIGWEDGARKFLFEQSNSSTLIGTVGPTLIINNIKQKIISITNSDLAYENKTTDTNLYPIKTYLNFKSDRIQILKDHRGKISGVYCLINLLTGNYYIGSSTNLATRLRNYLNKSFLLHKKNCKQPIIKALLKYNHHNFSLLIIEYSEFKNGFDRETFWITQLKPYYNVLKFAKTSLGYKHSSAVRLLLSNLAKNRKLSDNTKKLISDSLKGKLNPFFNKKHNKDSLNKIILAKSTGQIFIYDEFKSLLVIFPSLTTFAKAVKSNNTTIKKAIQSGMLFRGN